MAVIQLEAQVSIEQLLKVVEQFSQPDLEEFVERVLLLRAQRDASSVSSSESELLLKINQSIPTEIQNRFNELVAKRQQLTLTQEEQAELIRLTEQIEELDVERLKYLAELARLRNQSFTEIMADLNIQPPACV
jgi:hypothetical protein